MMLGGSDLPASLRLYKNAFRGREIRAGIEVTGLTLLGVVAIVERVLRQAGPAPKDPAAGFVPDPQKREIIQEDSIQQSV